MPRSIWFPGFLISLALASLGCGAKDEVGGSVEERVARPNILIYLVDTLRPDRLGSYGYSRPTSPNIDAFAQEATLFENAVGQSSWTRASMASVFTGVWPPTHGTTGWKHKLPWEFETLTEKLGEAGYQTAAFVGNPQITAKYGFSQGFDQYIKKIKKPSAEYNQLAMEWLDGLTSDEPWFVYIHTMDPHAPYRPPEPFRAQFAPNDDQRPHWKPHWKWPLEVLPFYSDRYDGEVAHNDAGFGGLVQNLKERGLYEEALVVFTSDHGEEFQEHGKWRHGENLHAQTLNVPLIIRFPGQAQGQRIEPPVQHIDLMPTLLDYLDLEIPTAVQGRSLMGRPEYQGEIYSHLFLGGSPLYYSVVEGDWKLIRRVERDGSMSYQLFNWVDDPEEGEDLAPVQKKRVASMISLLEAKLQAEERAAVADEIPLTEELKKELEAIGYFQ